MCDFKFSRLALGAIVLLLSYANPVSLGAQTIPHQVLFEGTQGQALLDSVRLHFKPVNVRNYDRARDYMYAVADNVDGFVECLYTGAVIAIDQNESTSRFQASDQSFNAEHVYPQSKGAGAGNARSDLHHLFPVNQNVNSSRGNNPFAYLAPAQVNTWWRNAASQTTLPTDPLGLYSRSGSGAFQPRDAKKGDVARAVTYFYVMYNNEALAQDPDFFPGMIATLLQFHRNDPVDQFEWDRTHRAALIQDNLVNPFVLDTSLVARIFFTGDFVFPDIPPPPTEYFVDFETGTTTFISGSTGYPAGEYNLNGYRWQLGPEALIGSLDGDVRTGSRSLRLRNDSGVYGSAAMLDDKPSGMGTVSFSYSRSDFSGDRTGEAPRFVAEFSTNQGDTWLPLVPEIDLQGVDELTTTSVVLNNPQNGRFRFRQTGGDAGKRWNLDDIRITNFLRDEGPFITPSVVYLPGFSYVQGGGPSSSQIITILAEELEPAVGELLISGSHPAFEVSLDGQIFSRTVQLSYSGDVEQHPVYVRLRDALLYGAYSGNIQVSGGGADAITVAVSGVVSKSGLALTGIGEPYEQEFTLFTDAASLPAGWMLDGTYTYGGAFGTGTAGGLRGAGTLGFQLTSSSPNNSFSASVTLKNDTGGEISDLFVEYTGRVARIDQTGTPLWQVSVNGTAVPALTFDTANGVDETISAVVSNLSIPNGEPVVISWSTTATGTSGTRRQIGIRDVRVEARPRSSTGVYGTELRGSAGYRMLTAPVPVTIHQLLNENNIYTQCFEGATVTGSVCGGSIHSNVYLFDSPSGSWVPPPSASYELKPGEGILVYVFTDSEPGVQGSWPKPLALSGATHSMPLQLPISADAVKFALVGNPSASSLRSNGIVRNGVSPVVYVWDVNAGGNGDWVTYNGFSGDLTDGYIAPFQGFFMYTDGLNEHPRAEVSFTSFETSETEFRGRVSSFRARLQIHSDSGDRAVWLTFGAGGSLTTSSYDALALASLNGEGLRFGLLNDGAAALHDRDEELEHQREAHLKLLSTKHLPVDFDEFVAPLYIELDGEEEGVHFQVTDMYLPDGFRLFLRDLTDNREVELTAGEQLMLSIEGMSEKVTGYKSGSVAGPVGVFAMTAADLSVSSLRYELLVRRGASPVSVADGASLPVRTVLHQNFPNPFNPATVTRFDLAETAVPVSLSVYDLLGREVVQLADGVFQSGYHEVRLDASSWTSGVYVYQLRVGEALYTRKLLLVR